MHREGTRQNLFAKQKDLRRVPYKTPTKLSIREETYESPVQNTDKIKSQMKRTSISFKTSITFSPLNLSTSAEPLKNIEEGH